MSELCKGQGLKAFSKIIYQASDPQTTEFHHLPLIQILDNTKLPQNLGFLRLAPREAKNQDAKKQYFTKHSMENTKCN